MSNFQPPPITPKILKLVEQISEQVGIVNERTQLLRQLLLRRENKVRTIQASLEIEGNTLSLEQVTAVLDGKKIIAPRKEVQEIKNALDAYDRIEEWQWNSLDDLLDAHKQLMMGLIDDCGQFRAGSAGVSRGEEVIHIALRQPWCPL